MFFHHQQPLPLSKLLSTYILSPIYLVLSLMACMNLLGVILHARIRHFIVFQLAFAFFFMPSFTPFQFMAQGRQFPNAHLMKDEEIGAKMRSMIGSRPPICEQRCRNCGRCEAVQVPIAPAIKFLNKEIYGKRATKTIQYSRGDDVSSYKPMCWKCKCGNFIFNP